MLQAYETVTLALSALLLGAGCYFTLVTRGVQVLHPLETLKAVFGRGDGQGVSPFEALATALAGSVGTGNIAGVASALAIGGPGAIFWMWVSAFLGMALKYAEVVTALRYRTTQNNEPTGGAMWCIRLGMGKRYMPLAYAFCILGIFAALGVGNLVQINTIAAAVGGAVGRSGAGLSLIVGGIVALAVAAICLGGLNGIARAASLLMPFMCALYTLAALAVILRNISHVPQAFCLIFDGAFNIRAAGGGALGFTFMQTLRCGVARGVFTHEAGMGSSPMAHSTAENSARRQGMLGVTEVFIDTMLLCTLTALVVLTSGADVPWGDAEADGMAIVLDAMRTALGGMAGPFLAVSVTLFAFSSMLSWSFYGSRCAQFLLPKRRPKAFTAVFAALIPLFAPIAVGSAWRIGELAAMLMALPNLYMLAVLAPGAVKAVRAGRGCGIIKKNNRKRIIWRRITK